MANSSVDNVSAAAAAAATAAENTPLLVEGSANQGLRGQNGQLVPREESSSDTGPDSDTPKTRIAVLWGVLPTLLIGVFIAQVDSSIVLASNQKIASSFNALSDSSWLITSYVLAQCATQALYGKLSDIFGRKATLVFAYSVFALGCALCGIGSEYWQVLAGRAVSGVGGAGMIALVAVIIADLLPVREVATWRSYINVVATLGRSCGGPLGGWLVDNIGWRWCFLGQCPFAAFAMVLVLWKLPSNVGHNAAQYGAIGQNAEPKTTRIDWWGVIILPTMLTCLFVALDFTGKFYPWYYIAPLAILASALAIAFYLVEKSWAKEPIIPMELLANRDVISAYGTIAFQTSAQFIILYTIPLYFQVATGMSVAAAGNRLVLVVIGNTVGGLTSGHIIKRTGRYKLLTIVGIVLGCTCYTLILFRWRGATGLWDTLYLVLSGLGMGTSQSTTFVHLAASIAPKQMAIAGTSWFLSQNLGVLVAANVFSVLHDISLAKLLNQALVGIPEKDEIIQGSLSSIDYIWALPTARRQLVTQSYVNSLMYTNALALGLGVVSLIFACALRERILKK